MYDKGGGRCGEQNSSDGNACKPPNEVWIGCISQIAISPTVIYVMGAMTHKDKVQSREQINYQTMGVEHYQPALNCTLTSV